MLPNWKYYKEITIDHIKVNSDLTDFPILVKLNSSNFDFSKTQSTGYDIRFSLLDGTLLKYEREQHNSANQEAVYWVKIPFVSSIVNTKFRLYFGNPAAGDGTDSTNVWDSGFKMVQHMNDNPDTSHIKDSTINGNDGTKLSNNNPIQTDGLITKAQSFSSDHIAPGIIGISTSWTQEAIIKTNSVSTDTRIRQYIYTQQKNPPTYKYTYMDRHGFMIQGNEIGAQYYINGGCSLLVSAPGSIEINTWYYIAFTGSSAGGKLYINGELIDSSTDIPVALTVNQARIGRRNDAQGDDYFNGIIDEVRDSDGLNRSAAYIKANDYNLRLNTLLSYDTTKVNTNSLFFSSNF